MERSQKGLVFGNGYGSAFDRTGFYVHYGFVQCRRFLDFSRFISWPLFFSFLFYPILFLDFLYYYYYFLFYYYPISVSCFIYHILCLGIKQKIKHGSLLEMAKAQEVKLDSFQARKIWASHDLICTVGQSAQISETFWMKFRPASMT